MQFAQGTGTLIFKRPRQQKLSVALALGLGGIVYSFPTFATPIKDHGSDEKPVLADAIAKSALNSATIARARSMVLDGNFSRGLEALDTALAGDPSNEELRLYREIFASSWSDSSQAAHLHHASGSQIQEEPTSCAREAEHCEPPPRYAKAVSGYGLKGEISVGVAYDGDASNVVAHVFDVPNSANAPASGVALVGGFKLHERAKLGKGWVYGDLRFLTKDAIAGPPSDYQTGELRLGVGRLAGRSVLEIGGVVRHGRFSGNPLLSQFGGEVGLGLPPGRIGRFSMRAEIVRQDYAKVVARDGWHFDLAGTLRVKTRKGDVLSFSAGLERKTAVLASEAYTGGRLAANFQMPITPKGTYINLTSTARYFAFDDSPAAKGRREFRLFNRAAIGVPVGIGGLAIELGVSHTLLDYNRSSLLSGYSSVGGDIRLIWKFKH